MQFYQPLDWSYKFSCFSSIDLGDIRTSYAILTCAGYLGYLFEESRDCVRKIPLSHGHDEEIDVLARKIQSYTLSGKR
jgi:hypothetical protein